MATLENFRLVVFRTVAEQLSFRKAAEELYLSQPAVSLQIKALEEDLGIPLFDRSGSRIALTQAGRVLLKYAQQGKALLAEAVEALAQLSGNHAGPLSLGASTTIAQYVLPRLLGEFTRQHPRAQITLISGNTEEIVSAVEAKRIDLGLIEGPARNRSVKLEPFLLDELVMIVPAAHEWAEVEAVAPGEMAGMPLLMRERGSGTRRIVELALKELGVPLEGLRVVMELDSTEAIKSSVEAGLGVGFVSRWAIARDTRLARQFKIVEIAGVRMRRDFSLAQAIGTQSIGLQEEFCRYLLEHRIAEGVQDIDRGFR